MIDLPPELTPSELLCCEELPPSIDELLRGSRSLCREGRLLEAERCVLDATEASPNMGAYVIRGAALVHLADVHREMGRLGPALGDCQKAHRIFQRQPAPHQRHNEAVAAYTLGLVHQLLGSEMDALKWYHESSELFEKVKGDWAAVSALVQVQVCRRIQYWIKTLSEYLTAARTRTDASLATRIWVPVFVPGGETTRFALAELEVAQYVVGSRLTINGEPFQVQPLEDSQRVSLDAGAKYYALGIPDTARVPLGAGEGDYVLIAREEDANREGPAVLETLSGPEFGNFERDANGEVNFVRPDTTMIGGKDIGRDFRVGYIAALLKQV